MTLLDGIFKVGWIATTTSAGVATSSHLTFGSLCWVTFCAGLGAIAASGFNDWRKNIKHGHTDKIHKTVT